MFLIAIDPGKTGAIVKAFLNKDNVWEDIGIFKMPDTLKGIIELIENITEPFIVDSQIPKICYIEKVGEHRQGNDASSSVTLSKHYGFLTGVLMTLRIKIADEVDPRVWEREIAGPSKKYATKLKDITDIKKRNREAYARKKERKQRIKDKVQKLYPDLKITNDTADAVGILEYGIRKEKMIKI